MKFKSGFDELKVVHSKGTAHFKCGEFETEDQEIIDDLLRNRNLVAETGLYEEITSVKGSKRR